MDYRGRCWGPAHIFTECPLAEQAGRDLTIDSLVSCAATLEVRVCAHVYITHVTYTRGTAEPGET